MHFEGINAKVHALSAKLLTYEDYHALCRRGLISTQPALQEVYSGIRFHIYDLAIRDFTDAVVDTDTDYLKYFLRLWEKLSRLDKKNRDIMVRIKGTEIDLINIIRVYRLKKYRHLPDSQIYTHLIPICYRFDKEGLGTEPYAYVFNDFSHSIGSAWQNPASPPDFLPVHPERDALRFMKKLYTKEARYHPDSLAVTMRYLFNKQLEIKNLTAIHEGLRLRLQPNEIMEYIV